MNYYVGNYKKDAPDHRGWVVGTFMEDGPRKTEDVEVMYWEREVGNTAHPPKISAIIECTFILTGKTEAMLDGEIIPLSAGDYVVIQPGTPNNLLHNILEDASGITIKAPSDPRAKKIIQQE